MHLYRSLGQSQACFRVLGCNITQQLGLLEMLEKMLLERDLGNIYLAGSIAEAAPRPLIRNWDREVQGLHLLELQPVRIEKSIEFDIENIMHNEMKILYLILGYRIVWTLLC